MMSKLLLTKSLVFCALTLTFAEPAAWADFDHTPTFSANPISLRLQLKDTLFTVNRRPHTFSARILPIVAAPPYAIGEYSYTRNRFGFDQIFSGLYEHFLRELNPELAFPISFPAIGRLPTAAGIREFCRSIEFVDGQFQPRVRLHRVTEIFGKPQFISSNMNSMRYYLASNKKNAYVMVELAFDSADESLVSYRICKNDKVERNPTVSPNFLHWQVDKW